MECYMVESASGQDAAIDWPLERARYAHLAHSRCLALILQEKVHVLAI